MYNAPNSFLHQSKSNNLSLNFPLLNFLVSGEFGHKHDNSFPSVTHENNMSPKSSPYEEVNVLMVSPTFQGHLNPTLNFAKRLASKDVHVTIALTEEARNRFQNLNASKEEKPRKIQLEFFSDGLSLDFDRTKDPATLHASFETKGAENFSNLISRITKDRNRSFNCVIINPFVLWGADVAATHGIPCALLWPQASALFSIYYRYVRKTNPFPNLENPNETVELPALPPLKVLELPTFLLPSSPPFHKKLVWDFVQILDKLKWVLGASVYEFEEEIAKSMDSLFPILTIGPLVSPFLVTDKEEDVVEDALSVNLLKPEDSCIEWLNEKEDSSVIYVAFGSLTELSREQTVNIATALKNTKKPFLWVVRRGTAELPPQFLEDTKGSGLVVTWCNQGKVLTHPAVACFVSHCGWNSTVESVTAGVPIIAFPSWSDQPVNAKLVEDVFGSGVRMRVGEDGVVSAEEVEKCITEVMEGPRAEEVKVRAMALKAAARRALVDGGSSDRNVNQFVAEIAKNST